MTKAQLHEKRRAQAICLIRREMNRILKSLQEKRKDAE